MKSWQLRDLNGSREERCVFFFKVRDVHGIEKIVISFSHYLPGHNKEIN